MGCTVTVPDLNLPAFHNLTLSSQLKVIDETLHESALASNGLDRTATPKDLVLIGSSMGGLLAVVKARELSNVRALVLLAPGFGLPKRWNQMLGENQLAKWKEEGSIDIFHYALNRPASLSYDFILDANRYQTDGLKVNAPTLAFHGRHDDTVPLEESLRFKEENADLVQLEELDDDHQLIESLDYIWLTTERFLQKLNILSAAPQ